ncbi:ATP synthase subunit I [Cognatiluteimonas weifangensis]|uniref:ATP synthase subunit I n=1 Tax=Cognatiluteimonas weifangensis TaxID=2303539 RepID=A0A372DQP8_9GAMM|nr:ATP synthase subunit I [Luteimonas weifangensis]RFP61869.1 hypothetical protein D0Y53_02060 [Luteimonas weifangensis]
MHDPLATGRRAALRAIAIQAVAAALVALAFLVTGPRPALAATAGGVAMLAGNALAAAVALGGGIRPARAAFARLLLGMLGKWVLVLVLVAVALQVWRLPPLPLLAGVAVGLLVYLPALNLRSANELRTRGGKVEREH